MSLTLEQAERALNAALAKANEFGVKMNVAVVDAFRARAALRGACHSI